MTKLGEGAGRVIAADVTTAFTDTDQALLSGARLTASVLEGTANSGMHPRTKQKLLESVTASFAKMLSGRKDMVQAHTQMVAIQSRSDIAEINFGCWGAPSAGLSSGERAAKTDVTSAQAG